MQCMKCGLEIPEGQVFCDGCLEVMEQFPVNPGTPVHIIPRKPAEKAPKKRGLSTKEQLLRQTRINRRLRVLILIMTVLLACLITLMFLWGAFPGHDFIPGITRPF